MLIALIDYIKYKIKPGRFYSKLPYVMEKGFQYRLPEETVNVLQPGDILFVQTLNSFISWLIMYLTKSDISHTAIYTGNGMVSHATTSGILEEPIESLYENSLIVPCRIKLNKLQQEQLGEEKNKYIGRAYNWNSVISKGLLILFCREHVYFRFSYFLDALFTLFIIDLPFLYFIGFPVFLFCYPLYLIIIFVNYIKSIKNPVKINSNTIKPIELYLMVLKQGGSVILNPQQFKLVD